jgi:hypothetical protein
LLVIFDVIIGLVAKIGDIFMTLTELELHEIRDAVFEVTGGLDRA